MYLKVCFYGHSLKTITIYGALKHLCVNNNDAVFDYSKYCEMQNALMASSGRLFRFYAEEGEDLCAAIDSWLAMEPDDIEVSDTVTVLWEIG